MIIDPSTIASDLLLDQAAGSRHVISGDLGLVTHHVSPPATPRFGNLNLTKTNNQVRPEDRVRVLLVEDNADALAILSILLERRGFQVLKAPDARTAVSVGRINDFDILLCDIGLPDGSGMDVLRELRRTKTFPSIAVTAWTTSRDIEEQIEAGFDLHVSKPYLPEDLLNAVRKLLQPNP